MISRLALSACTAALLALGAAPALAQPAASPAAPATAAPVYEPRSGQPGKDVVWVPTHENHVQRMLDMAKVTANDIVYDLGSGDGRTVIAAAKRGAKATGVEFNPDMVALSKRNAQAEGVTDKATFIEGDIFKTDFSQATVLTLFLLPDLNVRLRPTILEMKPGTRVVSNSFGMDDWRPDETVESTPNCTSFCRAHYWMVPAKVEGSWKLPNGELVLQQKYQMLNGTLKLDGKDTPITDAKMKGSEIVFTAGDRTYTGKVEGGKMDGTSRSGGGAEQPFSATRS